MKKEQAAQNQHYVPKFILRKFMSNRDKEQVTVFQKTTGRQFSTSISNIMAERRFHEFRIDEEYYASFEEAVCRVEDAVIPAYEILLKDFRITFDQNQTALLGIFIAFQMLRTRAYRDGMDSIIEQLRDHVEKLGIPADSLPQLAKQDEDEAKQSHIKFLADHIGDFAKIIADKDFCLLQSPENRCFYLSDNPVTLHNDDPNDGLYGNIGLSVKGIQIYVPLSSRIMLAAWCPSILEEMREKFTASKASRARMVSLKTLGMHKLSIERQHLFDKEMSGVDNIISETDNFLSSIEDGRPVMLTDKNMDHYNSIQVAHARDFVICQRGDFDLARRIVREHGATGGGWNFKVN